MLFHGIPSVSHLRIPAEGWPTSAFSQKFSALQVTPPEAIKPSRPAYKARIFHTQEMGEEFKEKYACGWKGVP